MGYQYLHPLSSLIFPHPLGLRHEAWFGDGGAPGRTGAKYGCAIASCAVKRS